ncbi:MAG: sulfatase [Thermodesulfobacteriota bacterium]
MMKQGFKTDMEQSPQKTFVSVFKWWLFIFMTVLLPLDFLYRQGSLLASLSPLQLARDFASIVVLCAIISLSVATIAYLLSLSIFSKGAEKIIKISTIAGYLFASTIIVDYSWQWMKGMLVRLNISYFVNYELRLLLSVLIFIILIVVSVFIYKKHQYEKNSKLFELIYIINIFIVISSLLVTILSAYFSHAENQPVKIVNKDKSVVAHPNIIIITFDSLAAQYTSLHGYYRQTTPNLDKLGRESYVFDWMYASCNWTEPSLSSIITGKYPCNHRRNEQYSYIIGKFRNHNLALLLEELGYETAMVWSSDFSNPLSSNIRGFYKLLPRDTLKYFLCESGLGPNPWLFSLIYDSRFYKFIDNSRHWLLKSSPESNQIPRPETSFSMAKELIGQLKPPFFLWIHIYPPHLPYISNPDFLYTILPEKVFDKRPSYERLPVYDVKDQSNIDKLLMRYAEHISYADAECGKFLASLKESGVFDQTILIVSSDHGEMFERGFWSHGGPYLYQPLIHVPLILHLPGQTQGLRVGANVSHEDIAPSILDFLGVKPPDWMDGKSFKPAMEDKNLDTGVKFSMQLSTTNSLPNLMTRSIAAIKGNHKLIKYLDWNRYELYNVKKDPREKVNLIDEKPEIFSVLKAEIDRLPGR